MEMDCWVYMGAMGRPFANPPPEITSIGRVFSVLYFRIFTFFDWCLVRNTHLLLYLHVAMSDTLHTPSKLIGEGVSLAGRCGKH